MSILLLSSDLVTLSKVAGSAAPSGQSVGSVSSLDAAITKAQESSPRLVILDLSTAGVDPRELVPRLKALPVPPVVVAFGPHVHEGRLLAAREAGCDEVLARGQFYAQVDQLIARYCAD